ncbi:MAG: hypothetical protein H7836_01985 [Magnetococcus sp. YQC-3]
MLYRISHITRYEFSEPVSVSHNLAWLHPRTTPRQTLLRAHWAIEPVPAFIQERRDQYDNRAHYFEVLEPHRTLLVEHISQVELLSAPPPFCPPNHCPGKRYASDSGRREIQICCWSSSSCWILHSSVGRRSWPSMLPPRLPANAPFSMACSI